MMFWTGSLLMHSCMWCRQPCLFLWGSLADTGPGGIPYHQFFPLINVFCFFDLNGATFSVQEIGLWFLSYHPLISFPLHCLIHYPHPISGSSPSSPGLPYGCWGSASPDGGHIRDRAMCHFSGWQPGGACASHGLCAQDPGCRSSHEGELWARLPHLLWLGRD